MIAVRITARGDRSRNQKGPVLSYLNLTTTLSEYSQTGHVKVRRSLPGSSGTMCMSHIPVLQSGAFWLFDFL